MHNQAILDALGKLTNREFVELFYESVKTRSIYPGDGAWLDCHLVLANAARTRDNGEWSPWRLELVCAAPGQRSPADDAVICEAGQHCGFDTTSWSKNAECPMCGEPVYGT
jgi:hypothetical protein